MNNIQMERVLYTANVHTTGGREGGSSRASDGRLDVRLSAPGSSGDGTNPEQLFAAAWSGCFLSAVKIVAAAVKVRLPPDIAIDIEVDLGIADGEHLIGARLAVSLPGLDPEVAQRIVDGAHLRCPYSKATRNNINVIRTVRTAPAVEVA